MAKIIQDEEQVNAFKSIAEKLDMLRTLDALLAHSETGALTISFSQGRGRGKRLEYQVEKKYNKKLLSVLAAERRTTAKDITAMAEKYRIQLDPDEEKLLTMYKADLCAD